MCFLSESGCGVLTPVHEGRGMEVITGQLQRDPSWKRQTSGVVEYDKTSLKFGVGLTGRAGMTSSRLKQQKGAQRGHCPVAAFSLCVVLASCH